MSGRFKYLFSPLKIRNVILKNRIVFLPHLTLYATEDGLPSERHAYYFAERAKGGAALIVMEVQAVSPEGKGFPAVHAYDRRAVEGWRKIADMVHQYDAKIFGQIHHWGNLSWGALTWLPTLSASPIPDMLIREIPKEMDVEEIKAVSRRFAEAARNLKDGGFDGVEISSFNHVGIHRVFNSPYYNRRTDEYGGSLENRLRFGIETIEAVREAVGEDFVVGVRLCLDELMEGGYTIKEGIEIARRLEATGKIDYISTDLGAADILHMNLPPSSIPPGYALEFIANVKSEVKLPVIAFGRINDPVQAESILEEGKADLIGMARALIADPELPVKAREGRLEDIRACVACNQGCVWRVFARLPITCIQNPAAGRERELGIGSLKPAAVKKRVVVVGGGPGGLKTAEIAALRGHRVTLFERLGELGGQVNIASRIPSREELSGIVRYLTYRLEKLGVDVRLNVEADVEVIKGEEPDVVVVATGSTPTVPQIPGAENLVDVASVLRGEAKVGDKVLLLDLDGHWAAAGTAEYLVERGKEVTIVTPLMYVGVDIDFPSLIPLYRKFYEKGVNMLPNTMVKEVKGETVICADVYSGREKTIEGIDTIVAAAGGKANDQLFKSLKGLFREVYAVGSCVAPRRIEMAIYEGEMVGRKI